MSMSCLRMRSSSKSSGPSYTWPTMTEKDDWSAPALRGITCGATALASVFAAFSGFSDMELVAIIGVLRLRFARRGGRISAQDDKDANPIEPICVGPLSFLFQPAPAGPLLRMTYHPICHHERSEGSAFVLLRENSRFLAPKIGSLGMTTHIPLCLCVSVVDLLLALGDT